jgi:hypothetical protein
MLIIKLKQQILILDKLWMRKHEINYHEKTNIIEFIMKFCTHSKKIETKMTNKEKKISFEKESSSDQSDHVDDTLIKNSRKSFTIVIKMLSRKEVNSDQSTICQTHRDSIIYLVTIWRRSKKWKRKKKLWELINPRRLFSLINSLDIEPVFWFWSSD